MEDIVIAKKLRGRPNNGLTKTPAERQRLARSAAHKEILTGDLKVISTSHLVSALPYFISKKLDSFVLDICREIERRTMIRLSLP